MINKTDMLNSVEKETQYLKETREYINKLKSNLIEKILVLQQNKKTGVNSKDTDANGRKKFSLSAEAN